MNSTIDTMHRVEKIICDVEGHLDHFLYSGVRNQKIIDKISDIFFLSDYCPKVFDKNAAFQHCVAVVRELKNTIYHMKKDAIEAAECSYQLIKMGNLVKNYEGKIMNNTAKILNNARATVNLVEDHLFSYYHSSKFDEKSLISKIRKAICENRYYVDPITADTEACKRAISKIKTDIGYIEGCPNENPCSECQSLLKQIEKFVENFDREMRKMNKEKETNNMNTVKEVYRLFNMFNLEDEKDFETKGSMMEYIKANPGQYYYDNIFISEAPQKEAAEKTREEKIADAIKVISDAIGKIIADNNKFPENNVNETLESLIGCVNSIVDGVPKK